MGGHLYVCVRLVETDTLTCVSSMYDTPERKKSHLGSEAELRFWGSQRNETHMLALGSPSRTRIFYPFCPKAPVTPTNRPWPLG